MELRQSSKFMKEYKNPKFAAFLKMMTDILEEGRDAGVLRSDIDLSLIARALFGMLDELALSWVLGRRFELTQGANQLFGLFMTGMQTTAN